MSEKIDIILFGASGFTGKHVIPYIATFAEIDNLKWGVADYSAQKLKKVLKENDQIRKDVPIVVADIQEEKSLQLLAQKARLIINCCGPFKYFGEAVVKACLKEKTHLIDISEEMQFMEKIQLQYRQEAAEKGVYIINACGFHSLPVDLGVIFLEKKLKNQTLSSVEAYEKIWEKRTVAGPTFNYATWESSIIGLGNCKGMMEVRKKIFTKIAPTQQPKLTTTCRPHKSNVTDNWAMISCSPNRSVVNRSQNYFYEKDGKLPIQFQNYFSSDSLLGLLVTIFFGIVVAILGQCNCGRQLLLRYPACFTWGKFSKKNSPSEHKIESRCFDITLVGKTTQNQTKIAKIQGMNPTYGATSICAALAAVTLLKETDKIPKSGGVYPPGYAFANTTLTERLTNNGIVFKIVGEENVDDQ